MYNTVPTVNNKELCTLKYVKGTDLMLSALTLKKREGGRKKEENTEKIPQTLIMDMFSV